MGRAARPCDAVIRFNDATTKPPFTQHAGSKTTIRLVNSQHRGGGCYRDLRSQLSSLGYRIY